MIKRDEALRRLDGASIYLEPLVVDNATDDYVSWLNDPEVHRYLDVRFSLPQTIASVRSYIESFYGTTEKYAWAMKSRTAGKMIGTVTIPKVNREHGTGGIGIMVGDKSYWGTPAAREALDLVVEFAFETLKLLRLEEHNVAINHSSNFMLRRAGFRLEGRLRQAYRVEAGADRFLDGLNFALLADEWRERRRMSRGVN